MLVKNIYINICVLLITDQTYPNLTLACAGRGRQDPHKNFSFLCNPASEWKHNGSYKTTFLVSRLFSSRPLRGRDLRVWMKLIFWHVTCHTKIPVKSLNIPKNSRKSGDTRGFGHLDSRQKKWNLGISRSVPENSRTLGRTYILKQHMSYLKGC